MKHKDSQLHKLYKDNKLYIDCIYDEVKSRPYLENSGYLSFCRRLSQNLETETYRTTIFVSVVFHAICQRFFHCKWSTVWDGEGGMGGCCGKSMGLKRSTIHTHTHTHTKHRAKNLGAFVDHLEKIIILTSSCLSVCLFAWNIPNPNKRIFQFIFGALTTLRRLMILVKMWQK